MRPRIDWLVVMVWGGSLLGSLLAWAAVSWVVVNAWRSLGVA